MEAVVLRHTDMGEADRLLWLFTRELGKVRAIAKGVRKLRSRKAGHLEPFTRSSLRLARGRDLWIVTQAETVDAYLPIREDLLRIGYAGYVVELLDRFTYEEGENISLYNLLIETLSRLSQDTDPLIAVRYYEIRLLDLLGFRPQLFQCARCSREIQPEAQFFSAEQGGVLCPKCGQVEQDARPASMEALRYLRHFQRSRYKDASRAQIPPSVQSEIEALLNYYLTYFLERALNTPAFLRRLRREARQPEFPGPEIHEPEDGA
jgi:DNA repair protein RecO (recombination protein O)